MYMKDIKKHSNNITYCIYFIIAMSLALGLYLIQFNSQIDHLRARVQECDSSGVAPVPAPMNPQFYNDEEHFLPDGLEMQAPMFRPYKTVLQSDDLDQPEVAPLPEFQL